MHIELINTGAELMLGRVLNTHQQWLCRRLADHGYVVRRQVAVDDSAPAIGAAVREALGRADLVITTGGLGPTSDDRTRDEIARLLDRPLREDPAVWQAIEQLMTRRGRPLVERMRLQALVPEGAQVLPNAHGTAPGLWIRVDPNPFRAGGQPSWLAMLPGPPRELQPMVDNQLLPAIHQALPCESEFVCRTLRTTGLGESQVEARIDPPLAALTAAGMDLAYCARVGEVDVRLSAAGSSARAQVDAAEAVIRRAIGEYIFGRDEESLEGVVVRLLTARHQTVAVAESCTGGYVAHRLTNVPGASVVFPGGLVTYSNEAKQNLLGVSPATLAEHGAVSEATAREMAAGARARLGADYALALTGIAGPSGGSPGKPVGTVHVALAAAQGVEARKFFNPVDRETFKFVTSQQALELLRRALT